MNHPSTLTFWALVAVATAALTGCAQQHDDLLSWMDAERAQITPHVTPLKPPSQYVPLDYSGIGLADPFGAERLKQALRRDSGLSGTSEALIAPELNRRKQPLEAWPLDTMTMVGSIRQDGTPVALLRVDQLLYQVHVGEYLGQNYGLVKGISENAVDLREIVQDAAGEWIERDAQLQLQEE